MTQKYQVCVAGAGFAGIGAAVSSARLGMKTLLIEKCAQPGGAARRAGHQSLCGLYSSEGVLLNAGLSAELEAKLLSTGRAKKIKIGRVWVLDYEPQDLQAIFAELIQNEPNLEVWFESQVDSTTVKNKIITQLDVRRQNQIRKVEADAVIDCSGAVIRLSGASCVMTAEAERQLAAAAFRIEGVKNPSSVENLKVAYHLAQAADRGAIAPHLRFTVWLPGTNTLRISVKPSDSGYDFSKIDEDARQIHSILKQTMVEFRDSTIAAPAGEVAERDGFRMNGLSILTEEDVLKARKGGGVKSAWPVEFWDPIKGPRYEYLEDGQFYEIPDACLRSKDILNLFSAGKFISADSRALASARMSGTCLASGEKSARLAFDGLFPNVVDVIRRETRDYLQKTALRQDGRSISYHKLLEKTEQLAGQLKKLQLAKYARVGVLAHEGIDYVILNLAILSVNAVAVPVPVESSNEEIQNLICSIKLDWLVFEKSLYAASDNSSGLTGFYNENLAAVRFDSKMEEQSEFESVRPAFIRFTSGTTGESKGVVLSHQAILERTAAADQVLKISHEDTVLWVLSMTWHFVVTILLYLRRGASIILCGHEIPKSLVEGLQTADLTFLYAAPFHYEIMTSSAEVKPETCRSVRVAVSTALALNPAAARAFSEKFGVELSPAYGIIEAGLPFINVAAENSSSVGRPTPGYECRLTEMDKNGAGAVSIKGPGFFDAYFSPWRKRAEVCPDGWFKTGDLGRRDEKGFLHLLGRCNQVINFIGMKIFPAEIEAVIEQHPAVEKAFVYGAAHSVYGQLPCAKIIVKAGARNFDENELRLFCYSRLAKYKVPKKLEVVSKLGMTQSGKVLLEQ